MSERQRRLKAQFALSSVSCLLLFVALALWFGAGHARLDSNVALTALWWGSLLASAAFGVAACQIDDDSADDPRYLSSLVSGIRDEWHHTSTHDR